MSEKLSYVEQLKIFNSLGYTVHQEVTKEMIDDDIYGMTWEEDTEQ